MMEAARTSETLVNFYQTTRRYNPEDSRLRTHRRENLKSYFVLMRTVRISSAKLAAQNALGLFGKHMLKSEWPGQDMSLRCAGQFCQHSDNVSENKMFYLTICVCVCFNEDCMLHRK
jgi:hypothetical protein